MWYGMYLHVNSPIPIADFFYFFKKKKKMLPLQSSLFCVSSCTAFLSHPYNYCQDHKVDKVGLFSGNTGCGSMEQQSRFLQER